MNWTEIWHDKWQKFNWHWKYSSQLGSCRVKTRTSDLNPWSQLSLSYSKRWIKRLAAKMCLLWFNRLERFSYELAKWFRSVFVIFFFVSQWMKSSKYSNFVFPPKKTLIWRGHCSIGQSCCSMTSKRSIDWFLESFRAWSLFTRAFA